MSLILAVKRFSKNPNVKLQVGKIRKIIQVCPTSTLTYLINKTQLTDDGIVVVHDGGELGAPSLQDEGVVDVVVETLSDVHSLLRHSQLDGNPNPTTLHGYVHFVLK